MDSLLGIFTLDFILAHWPFFMFAVIMGIVGLVSDRVLTRSRAYSFDGEGRKIAARPFWYMARVTQPLHPIAIGALLGIVMPAPEPSVTLRAMIILYFAGAGAGGLVVWVVARAHLKKRELVLPG